ncbi:PHD finger transcription factor isoform X2 [Tasmannia lanceolata]|uniref:PHD finger transcription factor isoform X2 n=1 Tax=Tasmannia lanceolata TaxID=3420 RepID=UPI004062CA7C
MAAVTDHHEEIEKKRKLKLVLGDKVEVRHFEDGLKGSWHPAIVIECEKSIRVVEYTDLLDDSGSSKLVESISVSAIFEGITRRNPKIYRGHIRPLPPCSSNIREHGLSYGLCVDAFIDDAWWEGVIFDREIGLNERLVFFPDQGDQQRVGIDLLRITQDWDEISGDWKPRGEWSFLELLKNFEPGLPVSVRQIWYDVRVSVGFRNRILEWIYGERSLWERLVLEAVEENLSAANPGFQDPDTVEDNLAEDDIASWSNKGSKTSKSQDSKASQHISIFPYEPNATKNLSDNGEDSIARSSKRRKGSKSKSGAFLSSQIEECSLQQSDECFHQDTTSVHSGENSPMSDNEDALPMSSTCGKNEAGEASRREGPWIPVYFRAECSHRAILDYRALYLVNSKPGQRKGIKCRKDITKIKAWMHLLFLGWNIESRKKTSSLIYRYNSPSGKRYYSLLEVCSELKDQQGKVQRPRNNHGTIGSNLGCKFGESPPTLIHPETTSSVQEPLAHSMPKENLKLQQEQSGCPCIFLGASQDSRDDGMCVEACQPSPEMLGSDVHCCSPPCTENRVLDLSEWETADCFLRYVLVKKEYCPQAVLDYSSWGFRKGECEQDGANADIKKMRAKAKMHLSYEGWRFWYIEKQHRRELRYGSPKGRCFYSLLQACKGWTEEGIAQNTTIGSIGDPLASKYLKVLSTTKKFESLSDSKKFNNCVKKNSRHRFRNHSSTIICTKFAKREHLLCRWHDKGSTQPSVSSELRELGFGKVKVRGVRKQRKRREHFSFYVPSQLCHHESSACLLSGSVVAEKARGDGMAVATVCDRGLSHPRDWRIQHRKQKKVKATRALITHNLDSCYRPRVLRSSKSAPQVVPCSSQYIARTVLSWLIDNDVVFPRQKVSYIRRNDSHVMAKGWITREGIKCMCCKNVYSLNSFEVHAGCTTNRRPAANIFLQDGRSLLQCQMKIVTDVLNGFKQDPYQRMKSDYSHFKGDNICSICHYGGMLVLCDYCPSAFHLSCIGLQAVPEGKWFCPSCRCAICGQSEFNADREHFTAKSVLYCDQCEREYHVGCLRKRGMPQLKGCPEGNWFCSKKCSEIFVRLQKLLGKPKPTLVKGLSWTILRSYKENRHYLDAPDIEALSEHHSKLWVALSVLHECFSPIYEPRTKSDLVKDVIFNKWSELKRLNFRGFYTILLEMEDELISVATVRIYGDKVAEIPLVGTRVHYRRQGMCRLLMDELEKLLSDLGVERLLLPAVPQLLETWTTSFGFTKMNISERLQFLDYTRLDFPDATVCQKLLIQSTRKAIESRGNKGKVRDRFIKSNVEAMDCVSSSIIPEVCQTLEPLKALFPEVVMPYPLHGEAGTGKEITAHSSLTSNCCLGVDLLSQETEQIKHKSEMMDQLSIHVGAGEDSNVCGLLEMAPPTVVVKQTTDIRCKFRGLCYNRNKTSSRKECLVKLTYERKDMSDVGSNSLKFYKRRRKLADDEKPSSQGLEA